MVMALIGTLPLAGTPARAAHALLAAPAFPGLQFGPAGAATLTPSEFSYQCNIGMTTEPVRAAGVAIAPGQAMRYAGCGQAQIVLNAPNSGHFQASFAVSDDAPAGSTAGLQLLVLGPGGFNIHSAIVRVTKGITRQVDVDVSGGVALALTFFTQTPAVIYHMRLTGQARPLRPVPMVGTGMPAGALPVPKASVTYGCVAGSASQPSLVSGVTVPPTATYQVQSCGSLTIKLPAGAGSTLALRYGTDDSITNYSSIPAEVDLRVLDASNHLLRKAIGLTYIGGGLRAIWTDTRGGSTAVLSVPNSGGEHVVVTSLSFLPGHYAPHANPDHQDFGSPSGGAVDIAADAMVNNCNAGVGTNDITVAGQEVPRDSYINLLGCGITELIMTNAHGRFHAKFGIIDTSSNALAQETAVLTTLDQNSHPLVRISVTARKGGPPATLDASIDNASILAVSIPTGGAQGVLYDMTLTGHATVYDYVFPPSEPPISAPGGVPIDPRGFTLACNVQVAQTDTLLIHQAALEQWSLNLQGCGLATLDLTALHGPHHLFSALYGLPAQAQYSGIAHLRVSVLDAKGKVLRTVMGVSRAGYGPRRLTISLVGGAKLQILGVDSQLTVFALTTA